VTLTRPLALTSSPSWALQKADPAQCDWLIHFCGGVLGASITPHVPEELSALIPDQRLNRVLYGFPLFGAYDATDMPADGAIRRRDRSHDRPITCARR